MRTMNAAAPDALTRAPGGVPLNVDEPPEFGPLMMKAVSPEVGTPAFQFRGLNQLSTSVTSPPPCQNVLAPNTVCADPIVKRKTTVPTMMFPRRDPSRLADLSVVIVVIDLSSPWLSSLG